MVKKIWLIVLLLGIQELYSAQMEKWRNFVIQYGFGAEDLQKKIDNRARLLHDGIKNILDSAFSNAEKGFRIDKIANDTKNLMKFEKYIHETRHLHHADKFPPDPAQMTYRICIAGEEVRYCLTAKGYRAFGIFDKYHQLRRKDFDAVAVQPPADFVEEDSPFCSYDEGY